MCPAPSIAIPVGERNCASSPTPSVKPGTNPPAIVANGSAGRDFPYAFIVVIRDVYIAVGVYDNTCWFVKPGSRSVGIGNSLCTASQCRNHAGRGDLAYPMVSCITDVKISVSVYRYSHWGTKLGDTYVSIC